MAPVFRSIIFCALFLVSACQEKFDFTIPQASIVDTTSPSIVSVTPPADGTWNTGDDLDFTVTFSEPVVITGNPRIVLTVGVSTLYAVAVTGALSSSHTFRLTISASHKDLDGIEHATPVELNGGRIVDNSGNSSGLDFTVASTAGVLVNSLEFNGIVQAILPLSDGKVVVAGEFTSLNGSPYNRIVRLTADHKIDTTFNPGTGFDGTVKDLILSQDGTGDYYAVGCFIKYNDNSRAGVVRINSDGSIDTSFDPGIGIENDTVCGSNARIETIKHTNDGSNDIYLGGKFEKYNGYPVRNFVRVNADGTRDTSFDTGNKLPQYKTTYSIEVPRDGSDTVVISGDFEDFNGNASYSTLFRISPTGDLVAPWGSLSSSLVHYVKNAPGKDQRFFIVKQGGVYGGDSGRIFRVDGNAAVDPIFSVTNDFDADPIRILQDSFSDEHIYVGGFFTTFGAQAFERIVKIKDDGTPVSPLIFPGAAGFDGDVRAIAQSLDGRGLIYAGGNFTTFDGSPAGYFKVIDEKDLNEPTARVTAVSTPEPDNTVGTPLNVGGNIFTLRVEFDQAVVVTGTPIVVLNTSTPGNVVVAQYVSGSGNNVLNFEYTLFSGQSTGSRELSYLDEHSLILNGGTISTADTGDAVDLRLPKVGDTGSFTANHNIFVNVP